MIISSLDIHVWRWSYGHGAQDIITECQFVYLYVEWLASPQQHGYKCS